MAKVFISYSRKDIDFAKRLTSELQKSELDFWVDWEGIPPTVDWWREVEKGIEEADVFLFLISPDSVASKVCGQEIEHAAKNGKRLIPLVVRDIRGEEAPNHLRHLNWIFFRESDDFEASLKKLLEGIHTDYEWVQSHRRLQVKALEWERNNKETSFLLRGRDLQDAEFRLATNTSKEPYPTDLQREYVFKSRKAADGQRRLVTAISVAGVVVLAVLAVFGFVQAGRANRNATESNNNAATAQSNLVVAQTAQSNAESAKATAVANEEEAKRQTQIALARQLAAEAQSINKSRSSKQMAGSLLAIQSMKLFFTVDAANYLINDNFSAFSIAHMTHDDIVDSVTFSPDGNYVVSGSGDG
ncbi:MAG TPA: TIR domain-containing protein, partial [Anaerolineales bacterium]|nr:TIR domain-containing protein [Anaerolineales bacterium]